MFVLLRVHMRCDTFSTGVPMLIDSDDSCSAVQFPQADGDYEFNEEHYTLWFGEKYCQYYWLLDIRTIDAVLIRITLQPTSRRVALSPLETAVTSRLS
jgi:hypothetical protein